MPVTDEKAAIDAISTFEPLSAVQREADHKVKGILASTEPFLDIHELFGLCSTLYFRSILGGNVEVSWSSRLTLCAGTCELVRDPANKNRFTKIRLKLSEPLLKFRSKSDVLNTLLHEMIHAYFFITTSWRHSRGEDGTGHGAGFLLLASAISSHNAAYQVTVFHTFHDEVDSYRTHIWRCDGPCVANAPFFGLVKRSMNRPPGKTDPWWQKHQHDCGGIFTKISEPAMTKQQLNRSSALQRAGLQMNKLDTWITGVSRKRRRSSDDAVGSELVSRGHTATNDRSDKSVADAAIPMVLVKCPICMTDVVERDINDHIDNVHISKDS